MATWFSEGLPKWMQLIEKSLPHGPGPYLVGSKISLADIMYYRLLLAPGGAFDNAEGAKAAMAECPRIKAAVEAVDANPEMQAYLAKRKPTMF
jgi:glutathione S-transferase